jgi:D-alanyl-D-alanine dipeptidase
MFKSVSLSLTLRLLACTTAEKPPTQATSGSGLPADPPAAIASLVGDYAEGADSISLREVGGKLEAIGWKDTTRRATIEAANVGDSIVFEGRTWRRVALGPASGNVFRITPRASYDSLMKVALAASPPKEEGDFLPADLVELTSLDSTIKLDIRYAGTNNFMGSKFYSSPRAFLQRPAAEAAVRAHQALKAQGYGLLIHDGYRPWYVTKMFWDATPDPLRIFVADPSQGSRHNRGCAVDLSLYDLKTGEPVVMPSVYDEMSPRAFPTYPGGTSRQRALRETLRKAMEAEGFTVYETEWWHFDYKDWKRYRIGTERFEALSLNVNVQAPRPN